MAKKNIIDSDEKELNEEKKQRDLTILRFHLSSWKGALATYTRLKKEDQIKKAEAKIKEIEDQIEKLQ